MYLTRNRSQTGYTRDGQQKAGGSFLILFSKEPGKEVRACVRSVRMAQCGQFMMGNANVGNARLTLSGAYGDDGLTVDAGRLPAETWETLVMLPSDLVERFWHSCGHNDAREEGPAVRAWAIEHLGKLRKAG